jgi:hypothetical protein
MAWAGTFTCTYTRAAAVGYDARTRHHGRQRHRLTRRCAQHTCRPRIDSAAQHQCCLEPFSHATHGPHIRVRHTHAGSLADSTQSQSAYAAGRALVACVCGLQRAP